MNVQISKLIGLLDEFSTGMLATQNNFGQITARPMTLQEARADRALWFVASRDSSTVENIGHSNKVNLSFRRNSDQAWISVAASAQINDDRDTILSLWQDDWNIWVEGDDKSSLVLVELEPYQIDFWEPEAGALGRLFELAKARFTEGTPKLAPVKTLHISDMLLTSEMKGETQ